MKYSFDDDQLFYVQSLIKVHIQPKYKPAFNNNHLLNTTRNRQATSKYKT